MCEHAHRSFQVLLYKTITQVLRIISLSLIQKLRQAKNRLQDHSSSQNLVMLWSLIILIMHYCISDKDKKESSYLSHRAVLQVQMSRFPLQSYIITIHRTLYFGCDCKRDFEYRVCVWLVYESPPHVCVWMSCERWISPRFSVQTHWIRAKLRGQNKCLCWV